METDVNPERPVSKPNESPTRSPNHHLFSRTHCYPRRVLFSDSGLTHTPLQTVRTHVPWRYETQRVDVLAADVAAAATVDKLANGEYALDGVELEVELSLEHGGLTETTYVTIEPGMQTGARSPSVAIKAALESMRNVGTVSVVKHPLTPQGYGDSTVPSNTLLSYAITFLEADGSVPLLAAALVEARANYAGQDVDAAGYSEAAGGNVSQAEKWQAKDTERMDAGELEGWW